MARCGGTVVERMSQHPKDKGLRQVAAADAKR
jgi:hypothetical protein